MYGKHQSEETKRKRSEAIRGEKHPLYGKHHQEETKQKISTTLKGKYRGENSPNFGRKATEEARQKMKESKIGKETGRGKQVYCIELDRKWSTIAKAQKETGACHISYVLDGRRNYAGRHPVTGEPLHWKLVDNI